MEELSTIFSRAAGDYELYRPGYPEALYRVIFDHCPAPQRALEVGIGTGQATAPILAKNCRVIALEPGEKTWQKVTEKFREEKRLTVLCQRFEDYQGPGDFDLIYAASSFHWVPEQIGYERVRQLLKPGGVFARFANHPYGDLGRPRLDAAIQALYARYMPGNLRPPVYTQEQADSRAALAAQYGMENLGAWLFTRRRDLTAAQYVGLLGTYSDHLALPETVRKEFFSEIVGQVEAHGGIISLYDTLDLQLAKKA